LFPPPCAGRPAYLRFERHEVVGRLPEEQYKSRRNNANSTVCNKLSNCVYIVRCVYWSSGNSCYHSVQSLLSSRLLAKNKNIKNYALPLVLFGCEAWFNPLKEVMYMG
jgi:hypothetical protein